MHDIDTLIIGAGVTGLALARQLAPSRSVAVLEQEARPGEHLSSRNSEVIHAGLYYPPDSLKAALCLRGKALLYEYCHRHHLPHRRCGKLVVAGAGQQHQLQALHDNARRSGAQGLHLKGAAWLTRHEPWLQARSALLSEETGIVDSHALLQQLASDAQSHGAILACHHRVIQLEAHRGRFLLHVESDEGTFEMESRQLINAAGLGAVPLLQRCIGFPPERLPRQQLARGSYFALQGRSPTQRLVYPLPEADGLGIHLTVDLAGQARFGPDVEWLDGEHWDYRVNPQRQALFVEAIQRYWPALEGQRLTPAYAGIRPKLVVDEQPFRDFLIQDASSHGLTGMVNLLGIESPGLTAALALAERVAGQLQ
ncbi:dehydrogenase [Alcanivorax hongdengensis A-11-3]|uniref:Dehydrogenase n=1 Tax=Alcanivorax hongdengensis A-11-3 TaxID=1177179 RepID=L0WEA8_9GAMM|nr:NAD(P)/FAD-dependent oxidoreductase [Alcanivorax hongdengensis]EKF75059.1 dehydrogenase [Alcanivorax hongdengensis A-11-3]